MPLTAMGRPVAARTRETVLHVYHPLGFPRPGADDAYLDAALRNGAGVLELGLPFSDPVADGPVLQQASHQAIEAGATTASALATIARLRARHPTVGLVVMAYANTVHALGWPDAASALGSAGVDGLIVPDMPLREARRLQPLFAKQGVQWIPLVSSTVPAATVREAAAFHPPFMYAASLGVTGQAGPGVEAVAALRRIRDVASAVPVAVGFGVRDAADVRRLGEAGADGVVVGSALVRRVMEGASPGEYGAAVAELRAGCS